MKKYCFNNNKDSNGHHEIHTMECAYLPDESNQTAIGMCTSCETAMVRAKMIAPNKSFDGCYHCCRECHKG